MPYLTADPIALTLDIPTPTYCAWDIETGPFTATECAHPTHGAGYFCPLHENPEHPDYADQHIRADIRFNPNADHL